MYFIRPKQIITTENTISLIAPGLKALARCLDKIRVKGRQEELIVYNIIWQQENVTSIIAPGKIKTVPKYSVLTISCYGKEHEIPSSRVNFSIGRGEQCDLIIQSKLASRIHAAIEYRREYFVLIDKSTNGTYVQTENECAVFLKRDSYPLAGVGFIGLGEAISPETPHVLTYKLS